MDFWQIRKSKEAVTLLLGIVLSFRKEISNMKLNRTLGMILLGIWLTVTGLIYFVPAIGISIVTIILAIVAIVAGLLILFGKG
jgi:hypothetical protein